MADPVIDKTMATRIATQLGWEPKREWVELTDEEEDEIWNECLGIGDCLKMTQAKLKEKNT
jgi:hypothetical protein